MTFELTKKQSEAFYMMQNANRPILWPGSIRSGKTVGTVFAFITRNLTHPGNYIWSGRTLSALMRNVIHPAMDICRNLHVPFSINRGTGCFRVGNSINWFFGANSENSQDVLQGLTARGFFADEAGLQPKSFIIQGVARCSMEDPLIVFTMNKTSPYHWIKRELVDEGKIDIIESLISDNPHITQQTVALYEDFFSGHYKARMLENIWAGASGLIYPDMLKATDPGPNTQEVIALDGAISGTTAALLYRRHEAGYWVLCDEYYFTGEAPQEQHVSEVKKLSSKATVVCDPSAKFIIKPLRDAGFYVIPANNKVESGIQTARAAMLQGRVRLRHAPNFEVECSGYVWDEKAAEMGIDKPMKQRDHACDAHRYFCVHYCKADVKPVSKPKWL